MKEVILITGSNGMVAKALAKVLSNKYSIRFLTRIKTQPNEFEWNVENKFIQEGAFNNVKHIIHLAGAGIANNKWSQKRKYLIKSSRIESTKLILNTLQEKNIKITSFISASAIGYYGTETTDKIFKETNRNGSDFLANLCVEWENAANEFKIRKISERTVILRIGIILSKNGGALKKMVRPIKLNIGSPIGTGKQYMPWIHINDLCGIIMHVLNNPKISGIFNAVAPEHIQNSDFTKTIAKTIKKPFFLPNIPSFLIKIIFGEMATILLKGSRVSSEKIISEGYKFKFTNLKDALKEILINKSLFLR